ADARQWIEQYEWPGNIRQLINVVRGAIRKELRPLLTAENLSRIMETHGTPPIPETEAIKPKKKSRKAIEFQAEPPFQLHSGTNLLVDAQGRSITIRWDMYKVLKALLHKDQEKEGELTFSEVAALYRNVSDPERAQAKAHEFARQLRRALDTFGIGHQWLIS